MRLRGVCKTREGTPVTLSLHLSASCLEKQDTCSNSSTHDSPSVVCKSKQLQKTSCSSPGGRLHELGTVILRCVIRSNKKEVNHYLVGPE